MTKDNSPKKKQFPINKLFSPILTKNAPALVGKDPKTAPRSVEPAERATLFPGLQDPEELPSGKTPPNADDDMTTKGTTNTTEESAKDSATNDGAVVDAAVHVQHAKNVVVSASAPMPRDQDHNKKRGSSHDNDTASDSDSDYLAVPDEECADDFLDAFCTCQGLPGWKVFAWEVENHCECCGATSSKGYTRFSLPVTEDDVQGCFDSFLTGTGCEAKYGLSKKATASCIIRERGSMAFLHLKRFTFPPDSTIARKIDSAVDINSALTVTQTDSQGAVSESKFVLVGALEYLGDPNAGHFRGLVLQGDDTGNSWFELLSDNHDSPQIVSAKFDDLADTSSWQLQLPKTMATNAFCLFYAAVDDLDLLNLYAATKDYDDSNSPICTASFVQSGDDDLGMTVGEGRFPIISTISEKGLIFGSPLRIGMEILKINNVYCSMMTADAATTLMGKEGALTIFARMKTLPARGSFVTGVIVKESQESKVGIGMGTKNGLIYVTKIRDGTVGALTALLPGMLVRSINNINLRGVPLVDAADIFAYAEGTVTVAAEMPGAEAVHPTLLTATVLKSKDEKVGIALSERDGHLFISQICSDGLLANTDLKVGMQMLAINNIQCTGVSIEDAATLLKDADGYLTVLASPGSSHTTLETTTTLKVQLGKLKEENAKLVVRQKKYAKMHKELYDAMEMRKAAGVRLSNAEKELEESEKAMEVKKAAQEKERAAQEELEKAQRAELVERMEKEKKAYEDQDDSIWQVVENLHAA